jgi:hypothetical protein
MALAVYTLLYGDEAISEAPSHIFVGARMWTLVERSAFSGLIRTSKRRKPRIKRMGSTGERVSDCIADSESCFVARRELMGWPAAFREWRVTRAQARRDHTSTLIDRSCHTVRPLGDGNQKDGMSLRSVSKCPNHR